MVAGTVAGSTLAAAGKAAMIQGAPAAAALAAQAGTAGGRAAMDMYRKNEATILEGLGFGKDVISTYSGPMAAPSTLGEVLGSGAFLLEANEKVAREGFKRLRSGSGKEQQSLHEKSTRGGGIRLSGDWDEKLHPRNSSTGEFINKK